MTLALRARSYLPVPMRPLVGRASERAQILARLRDPACRLVTITGPGGVGKTHLALDVARSLVAEAAGPAPFTAGTVLVPLAHLEPGGAAPDPIALAIADALSLDRSVALPLAAQLAGAARDRPLLLILDNCEHLPHLPALVNELLLEAPEITVLATSRERLGLRGEWVVDLDGLAVPPPQLAAGGADETRYDAVRLFVESARASDPSFAYTAATAPAVAEICRQVAGLPLGIELAVNWLPVLTCGEIAREIAQNLDFLAAELHDLPVRQQSLRAVFSSSWDLLSPAEQQAARRLACFQGDFAREAAAAVAGAGLPLLSALVKKSLVRRVADPSGAEVRYALLRPLRPYAAEQLAAAGEAAAAAARHAAHYLGWLATLPDALRGPGQRAALAALGAEIVEVRAAWRWAAQAQDAAALSQAAEALFLFATMRSRFSEGAELLLGAAEALDPQAAPLALGRLLARGGWCVFQLGRAQEARALIERSLALLRPLAAEAELVVPLNCLASLARHSGAYAEALALAQEGLDRSAAAGDRYSAAITTTTLSQTHYAMGRFAEARSYAGQSIDIERALGNRWGTVFSLITLGQIARAERAYQEAGSHFQEALAIRAQLNDARGMALCLTELGDTAVALGEPAVAGWCYEQSFELFRAIGNLWGEAGALRRLGQCAASSGQLAAAVRLHREALQRAGESHATQEQSAAQAALADLARAGAPPDPGLSLRQALADALSGAPASQAAPAAGAPPPAAPAHIAEANLTAREVEVLRLVATGRTDAQVAELLILSTRTINSYLSSIYSKLQVRSRSAATRWAIEHGIG